MQWYTVTYNGILCSARFNQFTIFCRLHDSDYVYESDVKIYIGLRYVNKLLMHIEWAQDSGFCTQTLWSHAYQSSADHQLTGSHIDPSQNKRTPNTTQWCLIGRHYPGNPIGCGFLSQKIPQAQRRKSQAHRKSERRNSKSEQRNLSTRRKSLKTSWANSSTCVENLSLRAEILMWNQ